MPTPTFATELDCGEVLDIEASFKRELKKRLAKIIISVLLAGLWTFVIIYLWPEKAFGTRLGILALISPWMGIAGWLTYLYTQIREAFWIQLASKYHWQYDLSKDFSKEKALIFQVGHSKHIRNGISGDYNDRHFHIFEYKYSIGHGKGKQDFVLTVFEIKFAGTFPHLYLDYRHDGNSNPPQAASLAKLSLPKEFESAFRFYSPKEYEIETLEIFTPDIFLHLLDQGWNHDMEFVEGELVIYRKIMLNSVSELDAEMEKIKKFVDILGPQLDRLKLATIGDLPSSLSR